MPGWMKQSKDKVSGGTGDNLPAGTPKARFTDEQKNSIREAIKRKSMQGMRELGVKSDASPTSSRYSKKAIGRGN